MNSAGTSRLDLVAQALLRYSRDPFQFRAEMLHASEVPGNLEVIVRLALERPVQFANPVWRTPSIKTQLARAALSFVGNTLLREDATHYQALGLSPDASAEAIRENHRLLIQLVHPDRNNNALQLPEGAAARVNSAYSALKIADTRAAYDQLLKDTRSRKEAESRKAAAFTASTRGVMRYRKPIQPSVLPEWLTAGVGGFVRQHPAFTIFMALVSLSVLIVALIVLSEGEGMLTRDAPSATNRIPVARAETSVRPKPEDGPAKPPSDSQPLDPALNRTTIATVPAPMTIRRSAPRSSGAMESKGSPPDATALVGSGNSVSADSSNTVQSSESPRPAATTVVSTDTERSNATGSIAAAPQPTSPAPSAPVPQTALVTSVPAAPVATTPARFSIATHGADTSPQVSRNAPTSAEIETLIASYISNYESGRLDAFAALFDVDARTNDLFGRAAIRNEYDDLFRRSNWRRISLRYIQWRAVGERTQASGEMAVKIGWRDGREVEQRVVLEMDIMRQGGRTVIARLSQQVRN